MKMRPPASRIRNADSRPSGPGVVQRMTGSLALLAILAMVLASPIHLMLAHGHSHAHSHGHGPESNITVDLPVVASSCGHHHHHSCDFHGPAPALPAEDCDDSSTDPCSDHAGDCETCTVLATLAPIDFGFNSEVADRVFLEFTCVIEESLHATWSGISITTRGPPARA